jgi:hypothetical protein
MDSATNDPAYGERAIHDGLQLVLDSRRSAWNYGDAYGDDSMSGKVKTVFITLALCCLSLSGAKGQVSQSVGLPVYVPTYCANPVAPQSAIVNGTCTYPLVTTGGTGIVVTRYGQGSITDPYNAWSLDGSINGFGNDSIYHTVFTEPGSDGDVIKIIGNTPVYQAYLLQYSGQWDFVAGIQGTYDYQNSLFPDGINGGNYDIFTAGPLECAAGDLLVFFTDANTGYGVGVPKPGEGWNTEATNGVFTVLDKIVPVNGAYWGNMEWKMPNGTDSGGTHWLAYLAEYRRHQP